MQLIGRPLPYRLKLSPSRLVVDLASSSEFLRGDRVPCFTDLRWSFFAECLHTYALDVFLEKSCEHVFWGNVLELFHFRSRIPFKFFQEVQITKCLQYKLAAQASASLTRWKCTRLRCELVLAQHQNLRREFVFPTTDRSKNRWRFGYGVDPSVNWPLGRSFGWLQSDLSY